MRFVVVRRALVAAAAITLLTIPSAFAESVTTDGDTLTAGDQSSFDLGVVQPGVDVGFDVYFTVTCTGTTNHVDATQQVRLSPGTRLVPSGGGVGVNTLMFALPAGWPADGADCPAGLVPFVAGPTHVILTAPTNPGLDYHYRLSWNRLVTPASANDTGVFSGTNPTMDFFLDVADPTPLNTAPSLVLPASFSVEGDRTAGATAAYTVSATDAEDAVAPTPTCSPVVGALLPLGPNTVSCTVTDGGRLSANGSFTITVLDTTAPALSGMPANQSFTTTGSSATLTYASPTASDVVDASPTVGCLPASGSAIPVGDTTVTCTARDASGNATSQSFTAHVSLETQPPPDPVVSATWEQPVAGSGSVVVNDSRTLPIKVRLLHDGHPVTSGAALLTVRPCGGGNAVRSAPLAIQSNGRWMGHLDTAGLGNGCFRAEVSVGGVAFGSFTLNVGGQSAPPAGSTSPKGSHGHGQGNHQAKGHDGAKSHGNAKDHGRDHKAGTKSGKH